MKLTKNFSLHEFDCRDGSEMPQSVIQNVKALAEQLQIIRDYFSKPITINSGYRSQTYNRKIGGAKRSQHLTGRAADITVKGIAPDVVADQIEKLIASGDVLQGGLGRYKTFTHYDIRGTKARWDLR